MAAHNHYSDVYARIQKVTGGRTQTEIANILGIRQSSISDAKRRNAIPADWYITLFEQFGVNPDWLKQGVGPQFLRTKEGYGLCDSESSPDIENLNFDSELTLPVYTTVYSMFVRYDDAEMSPIGIDKIVLPKFYMKDDISVFHVNSSSLSPTILKGSYVGIHTQQKSPVSGEIFAAVVPHEGIVLGKLFYDESQSNYTIRTNGGIYNILTDQYDSQIIGRLEWILQKM